MRETREAKIQIGDCLLTDGQSMAVRAAITNFLMECEDPEMKAELGPIADAYHQRLAEVIAIMVKHGGLR